MRQQAQHRVCHPAYAFLPISISTQFLHSLVVEGERTIVAVCRVFGGPEVKVPDASEQQAEHVITWDGAGTEPPGMARVRTSQMQQVRSA